MEADCVFVAEVTLWEQLFQTYLTQYASMSQKAESRRMFGQSSYCQGKASALHSPVEILLH